MNYTNTNLDPIGELNGLPIQPCVKSGFCCKVAPCAYGEWNDTKTACKFLAEPNEIGQRDCLRYQYIIDNDPFHQYYPGFGAGCSYITFNKERHQVIQNIKKFEERDSVE